MKQQRGRQLVLELPRPERFQPLTERPEGLLEALAELLLEALGSPADQPDPQNRKTAAQARAMEGDDEPEDHP